MELKLTADYIQEPGNNGYTGWINEIKGVIAHGDTIEEMKKELIAMLAIKFDVMRQITEKNKDDDNAPLELNLIAS